MSIVESLRRGTRFRDVGDGSGALEPDVAATDKRMSYAADLIQTAASLIAISTFVVVVAGYLEWLI